MKTDLVVPAGLSPEVTYNDLRKMRHRESKSRQNEARFRRDEQRENDGNTRWPSKNDGYERQYDEWF